MQDFVNMKCTDFMNVVYNSNFYEFSYKIETEFQWPNKRRKNQVISECSI